MTNERVTMRDLHAMKRAEVKIVGTVAWDHQMARLADRAEVDIISVGDSVGVNLWGRANPLDISMDEMVLVARAVRAGVQRALVSCDLPFGPAQESPEAAVRAAIRLAKEADVDMVKIDGASDHLEAVSAVVAAGIPVFAQFGFTPQTALRHGIDYTAMSGAEVLPIMRDALVEQAISLERAGASLLDFSNSGPSVGPEVVRAVSVPVLGGFGGGPWLDGRLRMIHAAIGYGADSVDDQTDRYANVARLTLDALTEYRTDVREGRHIRGSVYRST